MFKSLKDLKNYIDEESEMVTIQHNSCYMCGGSLIDSCGYEEYIKIKEYDPKKKFCSFKCLEDYLIEEEGLDSSVDAYE